jgi:hypothetical protein
MNKARYFLMMLLVSSLGFAADAQITLGGALNLLTSNWAEDYDDTKTRLSYSIGVAGASDITDKFGIGAELLFASIGPRIDDDDDDDKGRVLVNMIQIPLMASFEIVDGLKVHAGFQPGIIMSAKIKITDGPLTGTYDQSDDFGTLDLEFIIGGSYDITDNITAVLRINRGLNNMVTGNNDAATNTGIVIGGRYWFVRN